MVSLLALGNGVYNRDGIVVDYNGRQGKHPKECNCVKHINNAAKVNPPQMITQGVNNVTTPVIKTPDANVIAALVSNPDALNAYMATFNPSATPSVLNAVTPPVVNPNPVVVNPVVPEFVAGQTEYVIPVNIDLSGKPDSMAKVTDARVHAEPKFTNGIHDFRFPKGYASRSIVSEGVWVLKLVRVE